MRKVQTQNLPGRLPGLGVFLQCLGLLLEGLAQLLVGLLCGVGLLGTFLLRLVLGLVGGVPGILLPSVIG